MPRLTIRYNDLVLHDGEVEEFSFTDSTTHVSVSGKVAAPKAAASAGLLDLLAGARKNNTQKMVEERRRELKAEQAEVVADSEEPTDVDA